MPRSARLFQRAIHLNHGAIGRWYRSILKATPTASKISESAPSEPPPPPELELVALVKSTVAIAIAAGGGPVHVIPYVRLPALDSLIFIEPESARGPDQPSPALPPVAVQPSEFFVLHESVTLCATTCELILLVSVTAGVGVVDPEMAGAVYATCVLAKALLHVMPYVIAPTAAALTVAVPDAFLVPDQPSLPSPPVAVQTGPDEFHESVTGVSTTALIALAEMVVGGGAATVTWVEA
jgi:hypothetical protein